MVRRLSVSSKEPTDSGFCLCPAEVQNRKLSLTVGAGSRVLAGRLMAKAGTFQACRRPACCTLIRKVKLAFCREIADGGFPSPDGRYLAFPANTFSSNVWMIENFDQR